MEILKEAPVRITSSAIAELKKLYAKESDAGNKYLRVGVKGGGCSGLSYLLGFEEKTEKDKVFEIDGLSVIIDPAHLIYLNKMEINWEGGLNSRGFTFSNPNASDNCGCGTSFAV